MKNNLSLALIALAALGVASDANAYIYSFSNHTPDTLVIAMRYQGINEPLEQITLTPHTRGEFRPGDPNISSRKAGFIVQQFYYMGDPAAYLKTRGGRFTQANINNAPWRALSITWVPGEVYQIAINFAEALGEFTETAGKAAARAGAAYASGGASEALESATSAAKLAVAKAKAKGETLKDVGGTEFGLGKFIGAFGKMIAYSMARNRHIDIVKDEAGKLSFISIID
jgi:hypothetical protein